MGDHVVLDVDKLVEPKSVEGISVLGPVNVVSEGKEAGEKSDAEEEAQPLIQMAECRICQEEDSVSNLEMPCACSGSLKGGHVVDVGYVPDAIIQAHLRFRQLKQTAKGISMVKTPGQKAFGLMMLESSRDVLSDLGQIALFTAMLEQAELPIDIRNIDISNDFPDQFPWEPRVEVPQTAMYDEISDIFQSMGSIRIEGHTLGESGALRDGGAGLSMANPAR